MREKVDETICEICNWIQEELKKDCHSQDNNCVANMVTALAALISARA